MTLPSIRKRILLSAALLGLLSVAFASSARADYDPVGSGQTTITLDKGFLKGCQENGVKLSAVAPAKLSGAAFTIPAVGGKFDPVAGSGTVEGEGSLVLSAGKRKIPIKAFKLRTTAEATPFTAKVGGSQLKIATAKSVTVGRAGFSDTASVTGLTLSQKLATRLGKKLDLRSFFKAGLPLGNASTVAIPQTISLLERGVATLTLDPGFTAKLSSVFVAVNPISPAEHQGSVFTLPIFGGTIATNASAGRLETAGSLEFLQLGAGQVFWREPWLELESGVFNAEVDEEPSPPFPGKAGRLTIAPAATSGPAVANASARTVTASFTLTMDPSMAAAFESAFAKPQQKSGIFTAGEPIGTLSFTAQGQ